MATGVLQAASQPLHDAYDAWPGEVLDDGLPAAGARTSPRALAQIKVGIQDM